LKLKFVHIFRICQTMKTARGFLLCGGASNCSKTQESNYISPSVNSLSFFHLLRQISPLSSSSSLRYSSDRLGKAADRNDSYSSFIFFASLANAQSHACAPSTGSLFVYFSRSELRNHNTKCCSVRK